jgi:hypothetical protein
VGFQELQQLLQTQGSQAFRHWELWCLLARCGLQEGSTVVLQEQANKAFKQQEPYSLLASTGYQEPQQLLQAWESKPASSGISGACLPGAGFQEPQLMLQAQENKTCGQRKPWGLLANPGFWEYSIAAATSMGEPRLLACVFCYLWRSKSPGSCI